MSAHFAHPFVRSSGARHLLLVLLLAHAAPSATATTLAEAISSALAQADQGPRVTALRGEGTAIRKHAAGLIAEDPALRLKGVSDRATGDDGAYELEAMVDLPLLLPNQRNARRGLGDSLGTQADALQRLLRWTMAGRVREAAWAAKLAHGRLRQAAAALEAEKSLEAAIAKRTSGGELARLDLLTARQERLALEVEMQAAQLDYDQAISAYVLLTGQPRLPEPLTEPEPAAEATATLPEGHPLLASAEAAVTQARAERERTSADRRGHPILSLGAKRVRDDRSVPSTDALQLEVSIPFGLKGQAAPAVAGAERVYTDRLAELQEARLEAARDLKARVLERRGAADALAVAEQRARLAQDALNLTRRAFDLGETDLAALLRADERARNANLDLELRRLERGRASARLNQALGVVPE
jgi:cobalt-zinc-cadmium efflux system outer membrane protein